MKKVPESKLPQLYHPTVRNLWARGWVNVLELFTGSHRSRFPGAGSPNLEVSLPDGSCGQDNHHRPNLHSSLCLRGFNNMVLRVVGVLPVLDNRGMMKLSRHSSTVERLICNQLAGGSIPSVGSTESR